MDGCHCTMLTLPFTPSTQLTTHPQLPLPNLPPSPPPEGSKGVKNESVNVRITCY